MGDKGFMLKIMEVFLDIPWTCCLCGVASQSCYKLFLQNKRNVIVNDDMDNRQWIRCFKCFKSFHLICLSKDDGQFFDDYVIFRNRIDKAFLYVNCFWKVCFHSDCKQTIWNLDTLIKFFFLLSTPVIFFF